MYFDKFPQIFYDFEINGERKYFTLKDITENVRVRKDVIESVNLFEEYDIQDGETPEIISEKFYGTPAYHWLIMIYNHRYDYVADFPMTINQMEEHLTTKYGEGNEDAVHHYVNLAGYVVDSTHAEATSVSNRMFEDDQNENKRRIRMISPTVLPIIIQQINELL